ncbi:MAG: M56 family metallopeptidase [Rhodothermales bacterium]|nr:M56 family metallopeptidase [Rhodothermales bacterium]
MLLEPVAPGTTEMEASVTAEGAFAGSSTIQSVIDNLRSLGWSGWALLVWAAGAIVLLGRLVIAHLGVMSLVRRADRVDDDDWQLGMERAGRQLGLKQHVRLRKSDWLAVPVSVGLRRPTVVLPAHADEWDEETRQTVLLHELAHVRRRDCFIQLFVEITRSLYWVNPMVWVAAYHMKVERERACDDAVIVSGTTPSSYARALLDIARAITDRELSGAAVMAMARRSELEGRLLDILDSKRRLRTVNRAAAILSVGVVLSFAVPVSILHFAVADGRTSAPSASHEASSGYVVIGDHEDSESAVWVLKDEWNDGSDASRRVDRFTLHTKTRAKENSGQSYYYVFDDQGGEVVLRADAARQKTAKIKKPAKVQHIPLGLTDEVDLEIAELSARIRGLESVLDSPVFDFDGPSSSERHANRWDSKEWDKEWDKEWEQERDVSSAFIRKMKEAGFVSESKKDFVRLQRSGVDADLVESLSEYGYEFSAAEIASLSENGVDEDLVDAAGRAGLRLCADEFVMLARAGVDDDFVGTLCELGYDLPAEEIVRLASSGVDEDLLEATIRWDRTFSVDEIVRLSNAGVEEALVNALMTSELDDVTVDEILRFARSGACADCLSGMLEAVGDNFELSELGRLYQNGVDADFLNALSDRGLLELGVDRIIDLSKVM